MTAFSLATNERWRDKQSGEQRERAEFHRIVIFNDALAKVAEQYVRKGSLIYISGQLATRKWTDQSGAEKYATEVVLQAFRGELLLLGSKGDRDDGSRGGGSAMSGSNDRGDPDLDDEIPF